MAEVAVRTVINNTEYKIANEVENRVHGKKKKLWPLLKKVLLTKKKSEEEEEEEMVLEEEAERLRIAAREKLKASRGKKRYDLYAKD